MKYIINEKQSGLTVKEFLEFYKLAKSKIYDIFSNKLVVVNKREVDSNNILKTSDVIDIDIIDDNDIIPWNYPLDIVYEDEHLLIVNKKHNILVHSDGNTNETLTNAVSYYFKKNKIKTKPRYIHRLDYETSGLVIYTKDLLAASFLSNLQEEGKIKKKYHATLIGELKSNKGVINKPIGKDRHNNNKYLVIKTGKAAITEYKVLKKENNETYVDINLITGRTHQIRVHFSYLGYPLKGDSIYGNELDVMELECYKLIFINPGTLKNMEVLIKKD